MDKDFILSTLREHKQELAAKYPLKSLALFGSYARGDNSPEGDVDLLVEFNGPIGWEFIDLLEEFERLLEGKKIDLVSKRALKSHYRPYIEKDLIYV